MKDLMIAIAGNPNCGKTTLFNILTGSRQRVGNWSGVTVERKSGFMHHKGAEVEVVDLPGVYSLDANSGSEDEKVARKFILENTPDLIVNIVDATNLERNLYLTTQLMEMNVPVLVVLNMIDVAHDRKISIDVKELKERLGCEVITAVASVKRGIEEIKDFIVASKDKAQKPKKQVAYSADVWEKLAEITSVDDKLSLYEKLHLLVGGKSLTHKLSADKLKKIEEIKVSLEKSKDMDADLLVADDRYNFILELCSKVVSKEDGLSKNISDKLDEIFLNRYLGLPIFIAIMYLMFLWTISLGGVFIDFFDILGGTLFVDGFKYIAHILGAPLWLEVLVGDGVGAALQTVMTFIPPIAFLFIFMAILEDSGYMARAAYIMDKYMRKIGLPGKTFVPLIVGFGCTVPAVMCSRTLDNDNDRKITIAMAPFMSCGARIPVYAVFAAAFFPKGGQNMVFALYALGVLIAIFTGIILRKSLFGGKASAMIMELPPYHRPTFLNMGKLTWHRLKSFISKAGKIIMPMIVVLGLMNSIGTDGSFGNQDNNKSILSYVGKKVTPIFAPMGISHDNWPATVGLISGLFAKEAIVGTLDSLYSMNEANEVISEGSTSGDVAVPDILGGVSDALTSIKDNFIAMVSSLTDPLGISSVSTSSEEDLGVSDNLLGEMAAMFDGQIGAFSYLVFVLLYFPCIAAFATIYKEAGRQWGVFVGIWSCLMAYTFSTIIYQVGIWGRNPVQSTEVILIALAVLSLFIVLMRYWFKKAKLKTVTLVKRGCDGCTHCG